MSDLSFLNALFIITAPLFPLFIPGLMAVRIQAWNNLLLGGSRILIWSAVSLTILSLTCVSLGLPPVTAVVLAVLYMVAVSIREYRRGHLPLIRWWLLLAMIIPILISYSVLAIPFLFIHDGLPTGDSQKSIYWAQRFIDNPGLPDYGSSESLNRDPVDFYTPGLHALTALVMQLSPAPLTSVGLLAIAFSLAIVWLAAALVKELFDDHPHLIPPLLAAVLVLTNFRFLRYLREPGYHWQNIVGEFFLFSAVLLSLHLIRKWRRSDFIAFTLSLVCLVLTHQFSSFIAIFALLPIIIAWFFRYRVAIKQYFGGQLLIGASLILAALVGSWIAWWLGLLSKIPHLFNTSPHLLSQVPAAAEYLTLMGPLWLLLGISGLVLMTLQARRGQPHFLAVWAFFSSSALILILSQGPRIFIDIPPVRALFYTVVPLSVAGAYMMGKLFYYLRSQSGSLGKNIMYILVAAMVILSVGASTRQAYTSLSHQLRTNSTLTVETNNLIDYLSKQDSGSILIDDYNRRSSSWLILSGRPMLTRIAADLRRQMAESRQSLVRKQLYLNQLDYEKIYSLGGRPEASILMKKHGIKWLTGVLKSSHSAFQINTSLTPGPAGGDVVLYELASLPDCQEGSICAWLLRANTLANDIGDDEDTFEHLPASLRSTRLSVPQTDGRQSYRITSAPVIPLRFNVGDYTQALWDQDSSAATDSSLELYIQFAVAPPELKLRLPSGKIIQAQPNNLQRLPIEHVRIDADGFIEIDIINDTAQPVAIDLIALGPAHVP